MLVWEIVFLVIIIKIPLLYFGGVIWWSIKSEPEINAEGGTDGASEVVWARRRRRPRGPRRGSPREDGARRGARLARRAHRSPGA